MNCGSDSPILCFLQVDIENSLLQEYRGPDEPVDLILLSNMMIFIRESAHHQLTRCLQWLKPGGHLLVVGRNGTT